MADDEITKLVCANCGYSQRVGEKGGNCVICHRAFSPNQRAAHVRRLSSSHVAFGAHAGELAKRLEERRGTVYTSLAREGRELETEFSGWATKAPEDATRAKTITRLATWSRQALDLLSGQR